MDELYQVRRIENKTFIWQRIENGKLWMNYVKRIEYKTDKWQRVRNGKLWMKYDR